MNHDILLKCLHIAFIVPLLFIMFLSILCGVAEGMVDFYFRLIDTERK